MEEEIFPEAQPAVSVKTEKKDENWIWRIILILVFAGVAFLFCVSIQNKTYVYTKSGGYLKWDLFKYLVTLGSALLMSGACLSLGALTGFLFGIPRIINSTSTQNPIKSTEGTVLHNDNLVQISDWLTKIIVGVGLTQINKLPEFLNKIGKFLAPCFNIESTRLNQPTDQIGSAIAICVVLYFLILGFIACYLWTRFYFSRMMKNSLENDLSHHPDDSSKNLNVVGENAKITINENKGTK